VTPEAFLLAASPKRPEKNYPAMANDKVEMEPHELFDTILVLDFG
jgi:hypothetical protein